MIPIKPLLKLRMIAGLTQADVATKLGLTQTAISSWERGIYNPSVNNLPVLADLYGVTIEEILNAVMECDSKTQRKGN